jgi:hypothetical protein
MHFKIESIKGRNRVREHCASRREVTYLTQTIEYVRLIVTWGVTTLKREKQARSSGRINTLERSRKEFSVLSIDRPFSFLGRPSRGVKK